MFPKMKKINVDIIVFGFGELTSLLIKNFLLRKCTILCITENNEITKREKLPGLHFLNY